MLVAVAAQAEPLRIATWHADLSHKGPGLLVRAFLRDEVDLSGIAAVQPDVILLTDIDYDASHVALQLAQTALSAQGLDLPHRLALRPNTGRSTGLDLDGDGRLGGPRDAQGFGWFSGQGGMAVLSRYRLRLTGDLSALLWTEAPDSAIPVDDPGAEIQRLSTAAHWAVEVQMPARTLTLMTLSATPPVFDGPEDRNGRRNRDEALLWAHVLDGTLAVAPLAGAAFSADAPVIVMGNFNLDPEKGEGWHAAMQRVLSHPRLSDPLPRVPTVSWDKTGPMRVSYILPDRSLPVDDAGVTAPVPEMGPHGLVWVDLSLP